MHSKSRLWWSGPLAPFAAGFDAELARLGYTPAGTRRKLEAVAHLSCWLAEHGMTADDIGAETIAEFAAARRAGRILQPADRAVAGLDARLPARARCRPAGARPRADGGRTASAGAVRDVPGGRARAGGQDTPRAPGLGAPVPGGSRDVLAEIGGTENPDTASRLSQLEQALFDAQEALAQRTEELEAARQINRELMARLNRDS
jgi:hypothetical protein